MAYQSTYGGLQNVSRDPSGLLQLADTLRRDVTPALNEYVAYKSEKITEKTTNAAKIAARETDALTYKKAVESGDIDADKSPYYISVFNNQKGKAAGVQVQMEKQKAYSDWIEQKVNADPQWVDNGSEYTMWSNQYDSKLFTDLAPDADQFYKKGLDSMMFQINNNLSSSHIANTKTRRKEVLIETTSTNLDNGLNMLLKSDAPVTNDAFVDVILDQTGNLLLTGGVSRKDINSTIVIPTIEKFISTKTVVGSDNADFDGALQLWELANNYNVDGAMLFNAETRTAWNQLKETLISEQETHLDTLEERRKILQTKTLVDENADDIFRTRYSFDLVQNKFTAQGSQERYNFSTQLHSEIITNMFNNYSYGDRTLDPRDPEDQRYIERLSSKLAQNIGDYYLNLKGKEIRPITADEFLEISGKQKYTKEIMSPVYKFTDLDDLTLQFNTSKNTDNSVFDDILGYYGMRKTNENLNLIYDIEAKKLPFTLAEEKRRLEEEAKRGGGSGGGGGGDDDTVIEGGGDVTETGGTNNDVTETEDEDGLIDNILQFGGNLFESIFPGGNKRLEEYQEEKRKREQELKEKNK